jgi:hypothetical protein
MAKRVALALAGIAVIVVAGVLILRKDTVVQIEDAIGSSCASVSKLPTDEHPDAEKRMYLRCESLGPVVGYFRFADSTLARDEARNTAPGFGCVKGRELITSSIEDYSVKDFVHVCDAVGGDLATR